MTPATLDVYLHDRRVGRLERLEHARLRFTYSAEALAAKGPALSRSLPLRSEPFKDHEARPFFAGLLPEGELRAAIGREFGVSEKNPFALLNAIGGECAGAVSLAPAGGAPPSSGGTQPRWLDEEALEALVSDLPNRPLLAGPTDGIRISLAGAQDKAAVIIERGRVGITTGEPPTTHIIKTPIRSLDDTAVNEAYCLALARAVGLDAVEAEARSAGQTEFLCVLRYDRVESGSEIKRVHQEDFCQALGYVPEQKYEAEGGPPFAECAGLLREASAAPAVDLLAFFDCLVFNLLIGNHDAHAKNFSLLYGPEGTRLAPFYDLISTAAYPGLSKKLAMKVGGEYRPDWIMRRHLDRLAEQAGLGPAPLRRRVSRMIERVSAALQPVRESMRPFGTRAVHDRIAEIVLERGARLRDELDLSS